jgi:hypothetical protein
MNEQEKEIVQEIVRKTSDKVCPKCNSFLHSIPGEFKQDFCYTCGMHWTLAEIEDFCLMEIDKFRIERMPETPFISWCLDHYKRGIMKEINL